MWNFELVFVKHHETKSITLYSSRKMPKPKTYAYMYIYVHYYILPYINRFISICWIPLSISIHFLVYLEDTLSSRISPWQGAACSAVCYEIEMSPHGHFTFSLWNLEDTRCFPFSFLLGLCFTLSNTQGLKSSQNQSTLSLPWAGTYFRNTLLLLWYAYHTQKFIDIHTRLISSFTILPYLTDVSIAKHLAICEF